jgi:hypothetical protein
MIVENQNRKPSIIRIATLYLLCFCTFVYKYLNSYIEESSVLGHGLHGALL